MMKTSEAGINLIKEFEGLRLDAYKCSAGKWTIGYGHTGKVYENQHITKEQADFLLKSDIAQFEQQVNRLVQVPLTQAQFDALVSFTYNLGGGALERSTLLKKLNKRDYKGSAKEFDKWVNAGGKKLAGLVRRRKAEKQMFLQDGLTMWDPRQDNTPLRNRDLPLPTVMQEHGEPQAKKDVAKPVAVAAGGAVGVGAILEVANQAAPVANALSYLDWRVGLAVIGVAAIGGAGYALWRWLSRD